MGKINYRIIFFIFIFFLVSFSESNSQVAIIIQQPPPNQLKVLDLWNITLINNSGNTYRVYLFGTLSELSMGTIAEGKTASFDLVPDRTKKLSGNDKLVADVDLSWRNAKLKEYALRTGGMPEGNYNYCVYLKKESDNSEVGNTCISHNVMAVSSVMLLYPMRGQSDIDVTKQILEFKWIPPSPAQSNITYNIRIVEMSSGQTPESAILSNKIWFQQGDIRTTSFKFPSSAKAFNHGNMYAWKITGYANNVMISESEVWNFLSSPNEMSVQCLYCDVITNTADNALKIKNKVSASNKIPQTLRDDITSMFDSAISGLNNALIYNDKGDFKNTVKALSSSTKNFINIYTKIADGNIITPEAFLNSSIPPPNPNVFILNRGETGNTVLSDLLKKCGSDVSCMYLCTMAVSCSDAVQVCNDILGWLM